MPVELITFMTGWPVGKIEWTSWVTIGFQKLWSQGRAFGIVDSLCQPSSEAINVKDSKTAQRLVAPHRPSN
jgi:hypothetical protein